MILPNIAASIVRRFRPHAEGTMLDEVDRNTSGPLMAPLVPNEYFRLKMLSPMAKLDDDGTPERKWNYELPPMAITAMLINAYHVPGTAPRDKFPYALKAVGPVDPNLIHRGGKGLVSENVVIVP